MPRSQDILYGSESCIEGDILKSSGYAHFGNPMRCRSDDVLSMEKNSTLLWPIETTYAVKDGGLSSPNIPYGLMRTVIRRMIKGMIWVKPPPIRGSIYRAVSCSIIPTIGPATRTPRIDSRPPMRMTTKQMSAMLSNVRLSEVILARRMGNAEFARGNKQRWTCLSFRILHSSFRIQYS